MDFPESERADIVQGLLQNVEAKEAGEDLRAVMAAGAALGGESARDYVERLSAAHWWDTVEVAKEVVIAFDVAESKKRQG